MIFKTFCYTTRYTTINNYILRVKVFENSPRETNLKLLTRNISIYLSIYGKITKYFKNHKYFILE